MVNDTKEQYYYFYFRLNRKNFSFYSIPEKNACLPLKSLSASQLVTNLNTQLFAFN